MPKGLFEFPYASADGGLGQAKAIRGGNKALLPRDGDETAKLAEPKLL